MLIFICLFLIFSSLIKTKLIFLSVEKYPYVICDSSQSPTSYTGIEINLLREVFQQMNLREMLDYDFLCINSNSYIPSDYIGRFGGLILTANGNNSQHSLAIFSKGFAIILFRNKDNNVIYSKTVNIGYFSLFFVIPVFFGALIFLFSKNELNVLHHIWMSYGIMFFVKPIVNIAVTHLVLFQGILRFFLIGLLISGIINYCIISKGYYDYNSHLAQKTIKTFSDYSNFITNKNAYSVLMNSSISNEELENIILNSQENSLFAIDYYLALNFRQIYPNKIEIIFEDFSFDHTIIEFTNLTNITFLNEFKNNLMSLKKNNYQNKILKSFFGNNILNNGNSTPNQINLFYLLWIILLGVCALIILFKICDKFLQKKYFSNIRSYSRTMDLLILRKEKNHILIQESVLSLIKFSENSLNFLKYMRESFNKRQFYSQNKKRQSSSEIQDLSQFVDEINKSSKNLNALKEAQKMILALEEVTYYESDRFLKKRKKKLSFSKNTLGSSILNIIPKNVNSKKIDSVTIKNKTLYQVILDNIHKTINEKNEKREPVTLQLKETFEREDKIVERLHLQSTGYINRRHNNLRKEIKNKEEIDSNINLQSSKNKIPIRELLFKEDFPKEVFAKDDQNERKIYEHSPHNLPYNSSFFKSLVNSNDNESNNNATNNLQNSNNSILEGYIFKMINNRGKNISKGRIVEIEEEEKEYLSGTSPFNKPNNLK